MGEDKPIDELFFRDGREYEEYPWPEELEPLEPNSQFFVDLCELIEEYEDDEEERERYIRAVLEFGEIWLSNLHYAGGTW